MPQHLLEWVSEMHELPKVNFLPSCKYSFAHRLMSLNHIFLFFLWHLEFWVKLRSLPMLGQACRELLDRHFSSFLLEISWKCSWGYRIDEDEKEKLGERNHTVFINICNGHDLINSRFMLFEESFIILLIFLLVVVERGHSPEEVFVWHFLESMLISYAGKIFEYLLWSFEEPDLVLLDSFLVLLWWCW